MRKLTILAASFLFIVAVQAQKAEDAIKKTLQSEVDAIVAKNTDNWKKTWVHSVNAQSTNISKFGYNQTKSWDSLEAAADRDNKQNPNPDFASIQLSNIAVHVNGNSAWADYDAVVTPKNPEPNVFPYAAGTKLHNYYVLQKEGKEWKIVSQVITNTGSYKVDEHSIESDINTTGYRLIAQNKMEQAIEVFKLNTQLFAGSFNTWDSLGEAYALAGKKTEAIENYEKSMKLNPNSESGKAALVKLKQ